jgi:hypothetical protein
MRSDTRWALAAGAAILVALSCGGVAVVDATSSPDAGAGGAASTASTSTGSAGAGPCDVGDCSTCALTRCAGERCQLGWFGDLLLCLVHCEPSDRTCLDLCQSTFQPGPEELADAEQAMDCIACDACYGDCDGASACPIEL